MARAVAAARFFMTTPRTRSASASRTSSASGAPAAAFLVIRRLSTVGVDADVRNAVAYVSKAACRMAGDAASQSAILVPRSWSLSEPSANAATARRRPAASSAPSAQASAITDSGVSSVPTPRRSRTAAITPSIAPCLSIRRPIRLRSAASDAMRSENPVSWRWRVTSESAHASGPESVRALIRTSSRAWARSSRASASSMTEK